MHCLKLPKFSNKHYTLKKRKGITVKPDNGHFIPDHPATNAEVVDMLNEVSDDSEDEPELQPLTDAVEKKVYGSFSVEEGYNFVLQKGFNEELANIFIQFCSQTKTYILAQSASLASVWTTFKDTMRAQGHKLKEYKALKV